ncbi:MAG: aldolase/citrate lyase family protein [Bacteroidales bacterium]|jgi:citrate lyase subunit beta/citryl-CoA lyase|nr:aldolase/citrate lyase family protein [Bacteroidales bacterium]
MTKQIAIAGNEGSRVRSDCRIELEILKSGGIQFQLKSKVKALYGDKIQALVFDMLDYFGIQNARIDLVDAGALDYILAARVEAAIKQLIDTDKEYLPEFLPENQYTTTKDRFRFTRLYLPGNTPSMMLNAGLHSPDGVILDLEDSVAPARKEEARYMVRNTLRALSFYGAERMVRINQGDMGIEDLQFIIPHNVNLILIPKCETAAYIHKLEKAIDALKPEHPVYLMPIIESALGVENAYEIASSSENVVSLAIGLEDYTADLGTQRTREGKESEWARYRLVNAAKAARIQPIDSVFSDVEDEEGLRNTVMVSKQMGFEGLGCIHPRQIAVIQDCFKPTETEIDKACKIADAFHKAEERGLGVVALGSKMIDPPVVKRAIKTIDLAMKFNLISKDWRKDYVN